MTNNCNKCNVELTNDNWSSYSGYTCKFCDAERKKQYYNNHKEKYRERHKQWYQDHKEQWKEYQKQWYLEHPEYKKEYIKKYWKTPEGKIANNKHNNKRKRELGHIPLNLPFENSHGHHIDKVNVIYIPEELNKSMPHNVHNGKNMNITNLRAWDYLEMSVI